VKTGQKTRFKLDLSVYWRRISTRVGDDDIWSWVLVLALIAAATLIGTGLVFGIDAIAKAIPEPWNLIILLGAVTLIVFGFILKVAITPRPEEGTR